MQYDFSATGLLKEGFNRTNGVKGTILGALFIYTVITLITTVILEIFFPSDNSIINKIIGIVLSSLITIPIILGLTFLGINHARGLSIDILSIFNYYRYAIPLMIAFFLIWIAIILGLILFIIPALYLSIAYLFTYPLIIDKNLSAWDAMELSRKTITKQWFNFFGLAILSTLLLVVSIIPLGIGLIWSIPTIYIAYGLLYHHLFDEDDIEEV